ncbi:MAG: penicillin acylase family protein [Chitinophagales bacterium]|jgi:penicillin amidase|nr:penicillin acylase family protein [Chitinophagales bacterium]
MAKRVSGIILALLVAIGIYFLNQSLGDSPALGKFLSPTHGFWKNAKNTDTKNTSFEIDCIKGKATVVFDELGIPHIFADNEEDLFYAQGYVEAKDRLWQMEFQTHAAAGRLTELVGEKALPLDQFSRRIGLVRAAQNSLIEIEKNSESKKIIESFTAGVNAYIHQLKDAQLPLEYKLIGYQPEDWTPLKCALLMKYMAKDLTYYETDVENTNFLNLYGEEMYKKLFPDFPNPSLDPIIPNGTKWSFNSVDTLSLSPAKKIAQAIYPKPYPEFYPEKFYGSNNWCINGSKTKSGKPILCGDPHLGLNLPSIWYAIQLHCPTLQVEGVTIPGAPGVIIGHNQTIAWSVTNSERDVINNYAVEYNADKTQYKFGNAFIPFEYDVQTYKIKGGKDKIDSIRMTKVGSIIYDENFGSVDDKKHLATYWRAEEPSNELMAFYYLNKAQNHQDYLNALTYFSCPGQNFIYADVNNNIAIKQQGNFMLRTYFGDGSFVTPLAQANLQQLKARIPVEQNPSILNPERGFCSSANQNPVDQSYPYLTNGHYENYRNRVINSILSQATNYTWEDMAKLQNNNLSLLAKEILPTILSYLQVNNDETANKILSALKVWNYEANIQLTAPSYFYKLWSNIEMTTYDELLNQQSSFVIPENYNTANLIIKEPKLSFFDIKNTDTIETAKEVINIAFQKTVDFFKTYNKENKNSKWQYYKNTSVTHLAQIKEFSVSEIPIGGYNNIVNATSENAGPSWRMIVDFASGKPQCYGVYPGGQSGNVSSKNYTEFIEKWSKGEHYKFHFFASKEEALAFIKQ